MSLRAKVNSAVNKAFNAVGDLKVLATLSGTDVSSYNFATRDVVEAAHTSSVEVILQESNTGSGKGFDTTALMKSGPSLDVYDTLTVSGVIYNIVGYTDDSFVITARLVREDS